MTVYGVGNESPHPSFRSFTEAVLMFLSALRRLFSTSRSNTKQQHLALRPLEERAVPAALVGTFMTLSNDSVAENTWGGFLAGSLTPTLPGGTGYTTFTLVPGTGDTNNIDFFTADNQLRTTHNFNFEVMPATLNVRIKATAANGVTGEDTFALTLTNVNERPNGISLTGNTVAENSAAGTAVGTIASTDLDGVDPHTYTLVNSSGGKFQLNGNTLEVAAGANLDYEQQRQFYVAVQATDAGGLFTTRGFMVYLSNIAETPTGLTLSNNSVLEASPNGSYVGTLSANDPEFGAITYSLTDDAGGRFAVSGGNIVVANGSLLDFETTTSHNITVQATGPGGNTSQSFTINVTNANEAPTDLTLSNDTLALPATVVGTLTATDPDVGNTHQFILTNNAGGKFQLVGNVLQTTDQNLFKYDPQPSYQVTVLVLDQGGQSYSENFTITVSNIPPVGGTNAAPTDISISGTSVTEAVPNGSYVATLWATDDSPNPATLTLTDDAGGRFALNGVNLTVANGSLFDFETATAHNITVRATDAGGLTYDETITLTVNNVNEKPTSIALTNNTLSLPTTAGFVVGDLSATDPDVPSTFTFFMGENGGGKFTVMGNQIVVTDPQQFVWDPQPSYQVHIYVLDQGGAIYDQWFTITIGSQEV
jgi:hypothetical protein